MFRRNYQNRKIYGLKAKTYLSILLILGIVLPFVIFGRLYKKQENITAYYYNKAYVQEQKIKELTTYKQPELGNVSEQQKARQIIAKVWRRDARVGIVLAVCESGLQEKVVNTIGATGYFQINTPVHNVPISEMQSGFANAGYAYALWKEQGLEPWINSKECWEGQI